MKKVLSILMISTLMGCVSNETTSPVYEPVYEDGQVFSGHNQVKQEYEIVSPEDVVFQPDEKIQALQKIDIPEVEDDKFNTKESITDLSQKLRKELRASKIQVKEVAGQVDLIIPNKVAFGSNQVNLQNTFKEYMNSIVKLLKENEQTMIQVIGYTDEKNSVLENKETSLKRAEVIASFLQENGINPERIITDGAGADSPIANAKDPFERELNRRVEMTLISLQ